MRKKLTITALATLSALTIPLSAVFAADPEPAPASTALFKIPNLIPKFTNLGQIVNVLVSLAFFVAGLAMFFNIIIGGIQWTSAGGDPKAMDSARKRITNAVIGLIIVVAAYAIGLVLETVLGIKIVTGFNFGGSPSTTPSTTPPTTSP